MVPVPRNQRISAVGACHVPMISNDDIPRKSSRPKHWKKTHTVAFNKPNNGRLTLASWITTSQHHAMLGPSSNRIILWNCQSQYAFSPGSFDCFNLPSQHVFPNRGSTGPSTGFDIKSWSNDMDAFGRSHFKTPPCVPLWKLQLYTNRGWWSIRE